MKFYGKYCLYNDSFNKTIAFLPTITLEERDLGPHDPMERSLNFRFIKYRFVISWFK